MGTLDKLMARRSVVVPVRIETTTGDVIAFEAELRDPPLGETMVLNLAQEKGDLSGQEYGLRLLASFLWIDGERVTWPKMQALDSSIVYALAMQTQPAMNRLIGIDSDEAGQPKSKKKGKAVTADDGGVRAGAEARHDGRAADAEHDVARA
ncbi:hypothetical protein CN128_05195 [Sinorhizobium meliloti]|uniref:Tail assembly chaperone n=1 Tax=Sinorhizobium meliloti (strain SM11) TaxID=707241 RepID=F7X202_SINMM|nr:MULTISPECIES: hypothetical protein [Sinorhizobium]PST24905.1 hypothetical protein C7U62_17420 [Mesorhizobium loti]AEH78166.1 hypothetical protein SM11_chr0889 [Sinorhizobium meliloti SM11]ARS71376.1 hypothetical protein SMRU11_31070 [Sinorhizobium meliloti RU11/001]MBP2466354.1 hypothetical protein [Sinorhizobium meliloti]MCM5690096.1 hypothetical protein [Sinorhizobium meliloti]